MYEQNDRVDTRPPENYFQDSEQLMSGKHSQTWRDSLLGNHR